jgi:hypothetical protein
MSWYAPQNDGWSKQTGPEGAERALQVRADEGQPPEVRFVSGTQEVFHVSGVSPRPGTDTTHTIARLDRDTHTGTLLFAVHSDGHDLTFEDLRPDGSVGDVDDGALHHVQSSLNEILVPVYVDDVVSDLSERVSGLLAIHTAQYEGDDRSSWTYFRTALFEHGELLLEDEHGEL